MQTIQNIQNPITQTYSAPALGVTQIRKDFSGLVDKVQHQGDIYLINRHGKPVAAVVPMQVYQNYQQQKEDFFAQIRQMQTEADLTPALAEELAFEAIMTTRKKKS